MKSIVLIASSEEILKKGKALQKKAFTDVKVCFGLIQEGVIQAQKESKTGAKIFVARARTAKAIEKADVAGVVVNIPITSYDILRAITVARKTSEKIAIVAFSEMISAVELLSNLLDVQLSVFPYENEHEVDTMLDCAIKQGAGIVIGGETTERAAKKRNIPFVQIVTGEEAIVQALEEARRIAKVQAMEKTKVQLLETVTRFSSDAILIVDENMLITTCNYNFCQISGLAENQVVGKKLREVWRELNIKKLLQGSDNQYDELLKFQDLEVLCNKTVIRVNKKMTGLVLSFQEVEQIRKKEEKLRHSIYTQEYKATATFKDILGESAVMKETVQIAKQFALTQSPIFLLGETGVGKGMFAQSIHQYSNRASGAYVEVKCSSLKGTAFNQELLGQVASSTFAGKAGLLEIAHKGTLYLNEITELDLEAQGKLLNILQQQKVTRLGDDKALPIDVRVVASTSSDIKKAVNKGVFRADLYYQLNVLQLKIPALEKRREDIHILTQVFLQKFAKEKKMQITDDALMLLSRHSWHGNVRELLNVVERIAVTCREKEVSKNFMKSILTEDLSPTVSLTRELLKQDQIEEMRQILKECKGNYGLTAKKLGIDRSTLWRRLKKLGLK